MILLHNIKIRQIVIYQKYSFMFSQELPYIVLNFSSKILFNHFEIFQLAIFRGKQSKDILRIFSTNSNIT